MLQKLNGDQPIEDQLFEQIFVDEKEGTVLEAVEKEQMHLFTQQYLLEMERQRAKAEYEEQLRIQKE